MDKRSEFTDALKKAMREKDQMTISTVRLIMAALKDRDIAARTQGEADSIPDQEILGMLQTMIKQRKESTDAYENAGREELAERERAEIAIIERFLPEQIGPEEMAKAVDEAITETGAGDVKDMGKVMALLKKKYAGRMDMSAASKIVREKLLA